VIKLLQGSAVTQTVLGGLTIYILWLQISSSVYVPKIVIAKISRLTLWPTLCLKFTAKCFSEPDDVIRHHHYL